jgi:hypothetical protein
VLLGKKINPLYPPGVASATALLTALLLLTPSLLFSQIPARTSHDNFPALCVDLRSLGYEIPISYAYNFRTRRQIIKIQFLDEQRLALTWFVTDHTVKLPEEQWSAVSGRVHLVVVNAANGQQIASHDWDSPSRKVDVAYTSAGYWLLARADTLTLYSRSFEKINEKTNIQASEKSLVSPTGRTALIRRAAGDKPQLQLLDANTLDVIDSFDPPVGAEPGAKLLAFYGYSDSNVVYSETQLVKFQTRTTRVFQRGINEAWVQLPLSLDNQRTDLGAPDFLTDGELAWINRHRIAVVDPRTGKIGLTWSPSDKEGFKALDSISAGSSPKSGRFALIVYHLRGLLWQGLDMYPIASDDHVAVYSVEQLGPLFEAKVKGESPWHPWSLDFNSLALSPDGDLLAVVSSNGLCLYRVPVPNH